MIKIIDAAGSPDDIGQAIGRAQARSIHEAVLETTEFRALSDAFLGSDYVAALKDTAIDAYPSYMIELEGIAAGAEIDPALLFLWNCRGDLRLPPEAAAARLKRGDDHCTTLMAPGDADGGRPAVIAHNEDGDSDFMAHRYWLRAVPTDGPSFESFMYPGLIAGHSVGINAAGLVQTINNIRPDDLRPGVPRHFVCRAVLSAESIPDTMRHLARQDRASGFHHTIGAAGQMQPLSIEAPASGTVIRPVSEAAGHANHLLDDEFRTLAQDISASSAFRQSAVDEYLANGGDPNAPEAVLFQTGETGTESVRRQPGDGGDDYGCTLATAVFRFFPDRVDWTVHDSPESRDVLSGSVAA